MPKGNQAMIAVEESCLQQYCCKNDPVKLFLQARRNPAGVTHNSFKSCESDAMIERLGPGRSVANCSAFSGTTTNRTLDAKTISGNLGHRVPHRYPEVKMDAIRYLRVETLKPRQVPFARTGFAGALLPSSLPFPCRGVDASPKERLVKCNGCLLDLQDVPL